jgi:hypothetical protein
MIYNEDGIVSMNKTISVRTRTSWYKTEKTIGGARDTHN